MSVDPPAYIYDPPPGYTEVDPLLLRRPVRARWPMGDALVGSVICAQGAWALWGAKAGLVTLGVVGGLGIAYTARGPHPGMLLAPRRVVAPATAAC